MENKSKEMEVAIAAALEAGKIAQRYFNTEILKELKEDKSIVTLADKEAEEAIKKIVFSSFPDHSVTGEESGTTGENDYVWYVDPIDGTRNFSNGIPIFAVSIALAYQEKIILGLVYNPITQALFCAEKDKGAYLNDKKIFVSKDGKDVGIVTTCSSRQQKDSQLARNLQYHLPDKVKSVRNLGSCSSELALLARGSIEGNIQIGLSPYDFAAGALIAQEAGAKLTDYKGNEWQFPQNYFIASNGLFHDLLLEEVKIQQTNLGL